MIILLDLPLEGDYCPLHGNGNGNNMNTWRYEDAPGGAEGCREYVKSWREGLQRTREGHKVRLFWNGPSLDFEALRAEFVRALEARIALKAGRAPMGRKHTEEYQRAILQDSADLRRRVVHRVRVYQLRTPELHRRFAHLLATHDD